MDEEVSIYVPKDYSAIADIIADLEKMAESIEIYIDEKVKKSGGGTTLEEVRTIIDNRINELVDGAPETFDTLKEIADYITEHEEIAEALNEAIGNKADKEDVEKLAAEIDSKIENASGGIVISDTEPTGNWAIWINPNEQAPEHATKEELNEILGDIESLLAEV